MHAREKSRGWLLKPAGDLDLWQGAVDVLVSNSVNLMDSISKLVNDAQAAAVKDRVRNRGEFVCGGSG